MSSDEHPRTYQARKKLKEIFRAKHYEIKEEVIMDTVINNMEEEIWPHYRADMLLTKIFIIELDPQSGKKGKSKGHGTHRRIVHDSWRDKNVIGQINIPTVRLIPDDVLEQSPDQILEEINSQLKKYKFD